MMYSSLYSILHPFIEAKATGALDLNNKDGKKAEIFISEGLIVGCSNGKLSGEKAAKMVAKWMNFDHDFHEGTVQNENYSADLNHGDYIKLLTKIDAILAQVNQLASDDGVRLKMEASNFSGDVTLTQSDLKIAALLNGKMTMCLT